MTGSLDPARVVAGLGGGGRLGRPLVVLGTTGSTNAVVGALARRGERHGLVVVARRQTHGRGRQGRPWTSPPGGLYTSVLLRPRLPARDASRLGFAAAVAMAETLSGRAGVDARIDWPNDLVTRAGAKLGGVLAESRAGSGERLEWAVLGVGVNLSLAPDSLSPEIAARATSVEAEGGTTTDPAALLGGFLGNLDALVSTLDGPEGWPALRERFRSLARGLEGRTTRFRQQDGRDLVGTTAGIDDEGALRLRLEGGVLETVLSGERVHGLDS